MEMSSRAHIALLSRDPTVLRTLPPAEDECLRPNTALAVSIAVELSRLPEPAGELDAEDPKPR